MFTQIKVTESNFTRNITSKHTQTMMFSTIAAKKTLVISKTALNALKQFFHHTWHFFIFSVKLQHLATVLFYLFGFLLEVFSRTRHEREMVERAEIPKKVFLGAWLAAYLFRICTKTTPTYF